MKKSILIDTAAAVERFLRPVFFGTADVGQFYDLNFAISGLTKLSKPLIAIFPAEREIKSPNRREDMLNMFTLDLAILKKVSRPDAAEIDPLFSLAETVIEYFYRHKIGGNSIPFTCTDVEHLVTISPEMIEKNIFLSVIRIQIKVLSRLQEI